VTRGAGALWLGVLEQPGRRRGSVSLFNFHNSGFIFRGEIHQPFLGERIGLPGKTAAALDLLSEVFDFHCSHPPAIGLRRKDCRLIEANKNKFWSGFLTIRGGGKSGLCSFPVNKEWFQVEHRELGAIGCWPEGIAQQPIACGNAELYLATSLRGATCPP
jgi:hypothetical protein